MDWIDCRAFLNGTARLNADGTAAVPDPRQSAASLPPGALARVNNRWVVVGADQYLRSPVEAAAEVLYGVAGVPHHDKAATARCQGVMVQEGGTPLRCPSTGYDREMADGKIRRFVTPTWENSNDWTDPLLTYTMGESAPFEFDSSADAGEYSTLITVLDIPAQSFFQFDTSPAYPNTLFIGGNKQSTEYSYGRRPITGDVFDFSKRGVRDLVMWEYLWWGHVSRGGSRRGSHTDLLPPHRS